LMARIRSVHPGLFTDEAFVSASPLARLLTIGLWTEASDYGVFEWKPITLKMRLLPVDNVDVATLLAELERHNIIRRFEHDGRQYGAIRNFCRFQRPKKPKRWAFMTDEIGTYIDIESRREEQRGDEAPSSGELDDDNEPSSGEPRPRQRRPVPKKTEISPQMEDGGWREEENSLSQGKAVAGRALRVVASAAGGSVVIDDDGVVQ